jgi:hypothetical protein
MGRQENSAAERREGGRDRDVAGRARNARPRDAFGRPLPRGEAGEPRVPDDLAPAPGEALEEADRLLAAGRPFHAHEVLEARWKMAPPAERDLWQGLAQVAVGLTHAYRGNARGAAALLRRGAQRVRPYALPGTGEHGGRAGRREIPEREMARRAAAAHAYGADIAGVVVAAEDLADRIERDGLGDVSAADLRLRLRRGQPQAGG